MKQRKNVDFQVVAAACADIVKQGEKPSIRAIHERTGGSYSTIATFLRQWRQAQQAASMQDVAISEDLTRALLLEFNKITAKCKIAFSKQLETEKLQAEEHERLLANAEANIAALTEQLEQERQGAQQQQIQREKQLADLSARLELNTQECRKQEHELIQLKERCFQQQLSSATNEERIRNLKEMLAMSK